ncbi:MAG: hypothetical protein KDA60_01205 [Planctomycetales bacterium]|nr:hypothetical protein [Planctomycetales bacterium]
MQQKHFWGAICALPLAFVFCLGTPLPGQTIQLPVYRVFGTSTTISVPDQGSVATGHIARQRAARQTPGLPVVGRIPGAGPLFADRSLDTVVPWAHTSVSATIIDLHEMDRAVLAEAKRNRGNKAEANSELQAQAAALTAQVRRERPSKSGRQSARRVRCESSEHTADRVIVVDPEQLIRLGREAKRRGDYQLAKAYFEVSAQVSTALKP